MISKRQTLREWQRLRLPQLRNLKFPESRYANSVTIIAYTFPKDADGEAFDFLECSVLQTWSILGRLKVVIVANRHFAKVDAFAGRYEEIDVQIEPSLKPGSIDSMSADCCARLYYRFSTPYCLVIQDDGFPFEDKLGDFLGKYDYVGAPYVRISWWRNAICRIFGYWMSNGGFSLRSRRICEAAASYWRSIYEVRHPSPETVDDLFYTKTLPLRHLNYRLRYRIAPNSVAIRFSYDALVSQPVKQLPMGFHRDVTFEQLMDWHIHGMPFRRAEIVEMT